MFLKPSTRIGFRAFEGFVRRADANMGAIRWD
jgi:hypothetical protein